MGPSVSKTGRQLMVSHMLLKHNGHIRYKGECNKICEYPLDSAGGR